MKSDLAGWKDRATLIEASIRKGTYKHAESAANSLIRDITRKITGGPDAGRILAMPISLRALARIGLKKEDDALWDYQMTAIIWPGLRNVQLATYGPTGVRLAELVAEATPTAGIDPVSPAEPGETAEDKTGASISPPRVLEKSEIEYPSALGRVMKDGQVTIMFTLDKAGRLRSPTIQPNATQNAIFLFSVMEGVRSWRFSPAELRGEPVSIFYSLTVNFK